MTRHIYSVGQQVSFGGRVVTYLKRTGVFTITKLLPPPPEFEPESKLVVFDIVLHAG